jgi:soluble lytic murein transglycosylase
MKQRTKAGLWLVLVFAVVLFLWGGWRASLERSQNEAIYAAAARYGVDPSLVKAIVWRESRFRPNVRGRAGELGLMQIRDVAAQEWADAEHVEPFVHEHCLDPRTNTLAGTFYLAKLLKRYRSTDDAVPYALADYNAGRANALKWMHGEAITNHSAFVMQIRFPSTREYVKSITQRRRFYVFLRKLGWR